MLLGINPFSVLTTLAIMGERIDLRDVPSRQHSVEGKLHGVTIWLMHNIAKKLYACKYCRGLIQIGHDNVVMRTTTRDAGGRDHHHVCELCSEEVKEKLQDAKVVPSHSTTKSKLSKRTQNRRRRRS